VPQHRVVLAHGWLAGPWQLRSLSRHLRSAGFAVSIAGYPTAIAPFAAALDSARRAILASGAGPLHLVGYSYGGLVMRALAAEGPAELASLLLIGVPNAGSMLADLAGYVTPTPVLRRLSTTAPPLPPVSANVRIGCIAGNRTDPIGWLMREPNDGRVSVSSALSMPHADARILPIAHAALPSSPLIAKLSVQFLRSGHF
jgi:pimeloyl-ACP methyl ester carboxylesterase